MGKAAVDLPDPLQTPADAGQPLTSTDDLLAQLAGEEIDRLLAEVDDQNGGNPSAAAASRANPTPSRPIEFSGTPDPTPDPSEPPKFDDDPPATAAMAAAEPDVTAELDAFFKTAVKPPEVAPDAGAAARPATRATDPLGGSPTGNAGTAEVVEASETSSAERAGLNAQLSGSLNAPAAAAAAIKERDAGPVGEGAEDGPLPLYLKPLEWINAPMDACPSALRDFIGKAAIITLVNAAAVLAYVMLFRRR
jgi:hypothetical protein